MIEKAIHSLLLNDATVSPDTSALGTQVANYAGQLKTLMGGKSKVFRVQMPRASKTDLPSLLPALIIGRAQTPDRTRAHDGPQKLTNARLELHCVALEGDSLTASTALDYARRLLDDFHGSAGGIHVQRIFVEGGRDVPNDPIGAEDLALAQFMLELDCWFDEALA